MNKIKSYVTLAALLTSISLSGCSYVSEDNITIAEGFDISELNGIDKAEEIGRAIQEKQALKARENFDNFIGSSTLLDDPEFVNMDQAFISWNNKLGCYELTCYCNESTYTLYFGESDHYYMSYLFNHVNCKSVYLNNVNSNLVINAVVQSNSITTLSLQLSDIDNLDALARLSNLELLYIENCPNITNINGLNQLSKLKSLTILGTKIKDVSPLAKLNNLSVLNLRCNEITNPEVLASLANLVHISLDYNKIEDTKQLEQFINKGLLTEDTASYIVRSSNDNNMIYYLSENIETNARLLRITYFDAQDKYYMELRDEDRNVLCYTLVDDIYGIYTITKDLKNCDNLSLTNCKDAEITRHMNHKDRIQNLSIYGCSFDSLYFVSDFPNLEYLEIDNCPDITYEFEKFAVYGTFRLKKLKTLIVRDTGINNLSAFEANKSLEYVASRYNDVSDYSFLTKLSNLQVADLSVDSALIDYDCFNTLLDNYVTLRVNGQIMTPEVLAASQEQETIKEYK